MQGRLAYGTEASLRGPLDQDHQAAVLASPVTYTCDTYIAALAHLADASTPTAHPATAQRGCLGCLVDGYDHNCGFVGLAGLFGSRSGRGRR